MSSPGAWQGLLDENRRLRARLDQVDAERDTARELARDALARESALQGSHCEVLDVLAALHSAVLCGQDAAQALEQAGAVLRRAAG